MRRRVHTEITGNHVDTLSPRGSHDEAPQAIFQPGHIEVHEKADPVAGQTQVGEKLRFMDGKDVLDHLYFDNDFVRYDDIRSESVFKQSAAIHDRKLDLALERESGLRQFTAKAFLINRFKQSRSKVPVDLDRQADDPLRQLAAHQYVVPQWLSVVPSVLRVEP